MKSIKKQMDNMMAQMNSTKRQINGNDLQTGQWMDRIESKVEYIELKMNQINKMDAKLDKLVANIH